MSGNQYAHKNGKVNLDLDAERIGVGLLRIGHIGHKMSQDGDAIRRMTFKGDFSGYGEVLLVVTALIDGQSMVCFRSGTSVQECIVGWTNAMMNGTIKWKEDQYG